MAKDPAYLFYSSDFLTGTAFMSFEDRGKYITILCHMHQHGRLHMQSICYLVANLSEQLLSKFKQDENGLWYNERLEIEIEKRAAFVHSRRENAKKPRTKKGEKKEAYAKASAKDMKRHMHKLPEDENEIIIYFNSNGYNTESARKFFAYYSVANWHDGNGKPIKNWKQKAQAVWFKPENKIVDENKPKMVY